MNVILAGNVIKWACLFSSRSRERSFFEECACINSAPKILGLRLMFVSHVTVSWCMGPRPQDSIESWLLPYFLLLKLVDFFNLRIVLMVFMLFKNRLCISL